MTRVATLAAAAYLAITVVFTWPLVARLTSIDGERPASMSDVWAIATVSQKLTDAFTGRWSSLATFWDAGIFYPAPKALLYSEHLTGQSLLTLPLWWSSGNAPLVFNFTAIASSVLLGLGTFLLTRAYAGGVAGPLVTGLFAVVTMLQVPLDQVTIGSLSLYWLPFSLLAWHRYVARGTWSALALTIACVWLLNTSSTGYMWACAPLLLVFAVFDLAARPERRQIDRWLGLAIAVPAIALLSAPFILPLTELRRQGIVQAPSGGGIGAVSAGSGTAYLVVVALALLGLVFAFRRHPAAPRSYVWRLLMMAATTIAAFMIGATRLYASPPEITSVLYPVALFVWLVTLLAGVGLAAIDAWRWGRPVVAAAGIVFLALAWAPGFSTGASAAPATGSLVHASSGVQPPPAYLRPAMSLPRVYQAVASLASDAVLVEFPFGDATYELRYMFFSTLHRRRLMNGHGAHVPPGYLARAEVLANPLLDPERSVRAIAGATHVVVHGKAWPDDTGVKIARWIESIGGRVVPTGADALLYQIDAPERFASLR